MWDPISDFVTNSYGESWDSSCEKSWVPGHNQWVPAEKKQGFMLGPLCNQTVNLETDGKTLHYRIQFTEINASMGKNDSLFKDLDPQKNRPYLGGGDITICPIYMGGSIPQVPPPGERAWLPVSVWEMRLHFSQEKTFFSLWEEKNWTQESGRHKVL